MNTNASILVYKLQTPPRKNGFQFVHREYKSAINFPSLITSVAVIFSSLVFLAFLGAR